MKTHKKILIIEDNPDIAQVLSEVLSDCGHQIQTAVNGKDGLDHLFNHDKPDLIILDIFMPVIGGVEFMKRIQAIPEIAFIPIIGMSADAMVKQRCHAIGIKHFLRKPFELPDLMQILDEIS